MVSTRKQAQLIEDKSSQAHCHSHRKATILDSVIKTILSQNTTSTNCNRAFSALKQAFPAWDAVRTAPAADVMKAIRCGGLAATKTERIQAMLHSINETNGSCSLEFLRDAPSAEVKRYLSQFKGVGPKTASCVLLFAMGRDDFAVDTHIHRMAARLGWTPREALIKRVNKLAPDVAAQTAAIRDDAPTASLQLGTSQAPTLAPGATSGPPVPADVPQRQLLPEGQSASAAAHAQAADQGSTAPWPRVTRETTYEHLNATLPNDTKYALHLLMIERT